MLRHLHPPGERRTERTTSAAIVQNASKHPGPATQRSRLAVFQSSGLQLSINGISSSLATRGVAPQSSTHAAWSVRVAPWRPPAEWSESQDLRWGRGRSQVRLVVHEVAPGCEKPEEREKWGRMGANGTKMASKMACGLSGEYDNHPSLPIFPSVIEAHTSREINLSWSSTRSTSFIKFSPLCLAEAGPKNTRLPHTATPKSSQKTVPNKSLQSSQEIGRAQRVPDPSQ